MWPFNRKPKPTPAATVDISLYREEAVMRARAEQALFIEQCSHDETKKELKKVQNTLNHVKKWIFVTHGLSKIQSQKEMVDILSPLTKL
jgi:hypothetical protein